MRPRIDVSTLKPTDYIWIGSERRLAAEFRSIDGQVTPWADSVPLDDDELTRAEVLCARIEAARREQALAGTAEDKERVQAKAFQKLPAVTAKSEGDVGDQVVALLQQERGHVRP